MPIVLPKMLARGEGYIVNTASFAGLYPYATNRIPYAASKAALVSMSENLAIYAPTARNPGQLPVSRTHDDHINAGHETVVGQRHHAGARQAFEVKSQEDAAKSSRGRHVCGTRHHSNA